MSSAARRLRRELASADPAATTHCFAVHARAEPGVMPRVLELFAKRGLVPSSWHSRTGGAREEELTIDIQMSGLDGHLAEVIASQLHQIVAVDVVLTAQKR
jgi:acetolactate synthase small subunit